MFIKPANLQELTSVLYNKSLLHKYRAQTYEMSVSSNFANLWNMSSHSWRFPHHEKWQCNAAFCKVSLHFDENPTKKKELNRYIINSRLKWCGRIICGRRKTMTKGWTRNYRIKNTQADT